MLNIALTILVSFVTIWILHSLWNYMKDSYSPQKTKDLVGSQTRKYQKMIDEILKTQSTREDPLLTDEENRQIAQDLSNYMEEQLKNREIA